VQRLNAIEEGTKVIWYDESTQTNIMGTVVYKVYWNPGQITVLKVRLLSGETRWVEEDACHLLL